MNKVSTYLSKWQQSFCIEQSLLGWSSVHSLGYNQIKRHYLHTSASGLLHQKKKVTKSSLLAVEEPQHLKAQSPWVSNPTHEGSLRECRTWQTSEGFCKDVIDGFRFVYVLVGKTRWRRNYMETFGAMPRGKSTIKDRSELFSRFLDDMKHYFCA